MLAVASIGLVINIVGMLLLRKGAGESLNLKGAYFEVMSDLLTSIGVIAAALVMVLTGWRYADPLISAGIGLFILPRTWMLLRDAVGILLEGTPSDVNLAAVREAMASIEGVQGVHDLYVWALTSGVNALSVHLVATGGTDHCQVRRSAHGTVTQKFPIQHVTIQVEDSGEAACDTCDSGLSLRAPHCRA